MADFVGALKKTLDGLGNPTPEIRARVYDKARSTIADKLAKNIPPLAPSVVAQHKRTLEDAIASVERSYAKPAPASDPLSELEDIFSSIDRNKNQPSHVRQPAKAEPAWQPAKSEPEWQPAPAAQAAPNWQKPPLAASPPEHIDSEPSDAELPAAYEKSDSFRDDVFPNDEAPAPDIFQRQRPAERRRSYGGLIAAVVALLVIAGGGYGIWLNKDAFSNMLGLNSTTVATIEPLVKPTPAEPATDAAARPPAAAAPADAEGTKFTQRLTPEGGEVDPGPASGQGGIGEGESVAALTTPPPAAPAPAAPAGAPPAPNAAATPGAGAATPPADGATPTPAAPTDSATAPAAPAPGAAPTAAPAETALAVGQKAIFYEERTS
ncbi:hypothetical protein, partial [Mesorhizobium sp.]|uniref:hypothetical protein n=1 Tax=Mesorhizobium sp. TaxID=1871066 RepID=UPI0025DB4BB7